MGEDAVMADAPMRAVPQSESDALAGDRNDGYTRPYLTSLAELEDARNELNSAYERYQIARKNHIEYYEKLAAMMNEDKNRLFSDPTEAAVTSKA